MNAYRPRISRAITAAAQAIAITLLTAAHRLHKYELKRTKAVARNTARDLALATEKFERDQRGRILAIQQAINEAKDKAVAAELHAANVSIAVDNELSTTTAVHVSV